MFAHRFDEKNGKIHLDDISADPPKGLDRDKAERRFAELGDKLFALQDELFSAKTQSVLVVLQGRDGAGKDGTIKHVVGCLNPRGVHVTSFGVPTTEEREHDFLWRVHKHAPRKGEFAIFNRSHYEDVLVVRVHDLAPKTLWKERYRHIGDFEELLVEHGTIVVKFFLHITKTEQEERLLERENNPQAGWKLNPNDWKERDHWDEYTEAYEDAIAKTSTKAAPWFVIPANSKWFRNLAVAEALVETLAPHRDDWRRALEKIAEEARRELDAYRAALAPKGARSRG